MSKMHELKKKTVEWFAENKRIAKNDLNKLSIEFAMALSKLSKLPSVDADCNANVYIEEFVSRLKRLMQANPQVSTEELKVRMNWLAQDVENDLVWAKTHT